MSRFNDCESCAFHHVEEAICDECIDADQWESEDSSEMGIVTTSAKNVRIMKFYGGKKLKAEA